MVSAGGSYREDPDAEICCLIGSDKLDIFCQAHRLEQFLERYYYAVVKQDDNIEEILRRYPKAFRRKERFLTVNAPDGIVGISSGAVRELHRPGKTIPETMLHPGVLEIMKRELIWEEIPEM